MTGILEDTSLALKVIESGTPCDARPFFYYEKKHFWPTLPGSKLPGFFPVLVGGAVSLADSSILLKTKIGIPEYCNICN